MSAQNKNALNDLCVESLKHVSISSGYTGYNAGVPMTFTGYTDRQLMGVPAGCSEKQIKTKFSMIRNEVIPVEVMTVVGFFYLQWVHP